MATLSVFYPYHQNLHYVQLASAHRQGLAADQFIYFLLYMLTNISSISLNLSWTDRQINCPAPFLKIDCFCKYIPTCVSQAFFLYYPLKPAVKTTINVPICNLCGALRDNMVKNRYCDALLCGALRDNMVKNRYCDVRSVNTEWNKVIDCAYMNICENKKIKCQNFEKNSKMLNKS